MPSTLYCCPAPIVLLYRCCCCRYGGIGGLSEAIGWTEVQREEQKGSFLGGMDGVIRVAVAILVADALLFVYEQVGPGRDRDPMHRVRGLSCRVRWGPGRARPRGPGPGQRRGAWGRDGGCDCARPLRASQEAVEMDRRRSSGLQLCYSMA